jgi:hypothetical protein
VTDEEENPKTVWIRTAPDADGVYRPVLEVDADTAYNLTEDSACKYAMYVLRAVAVAEHDAAVFRQLKEITGSEDAAAQLIRDLREERPPLVPLLPLVLVPGVSALTKEAFLDIEIHGSKEGQWTMADAREHALTVLEMVCVADLDGAYLRILKTIGIEDDRARAVIGDLGNWRKP